MARAEHTLPDVPLSRPVLDRRADRRPDPHVLPRLLADPATRVLRLVGDLVEVADEGGGPRLVLSPPVPEDGDLLAVYLGEREGVEHLAVVRDAADEGSAGEGPVLAHDQAWRTLRQVGAHLDDVSASLFATALALGNWHRTHGHCPRCGAATEPALAGWIRRCPSDGSEHYPRTDVAIIVAVVDAADRLLLARGRGFRSGGVSVLAGFLEPGETLAAAVAREVAEEVGVAVEDVTYLADQPWPFPSSLMVGFRARALGTDLRLQEDEIASARWFTREELARGVASGEVVLPGRVSIARLLVEHWYGDRIDAPDHSGLR